MEAMNKMSAPQMVMENIDRAPWWPTLWTEFALLLADLESDPKYSKRAKHISELMADPRFPKANQIYFVPPKLARTE
jgi:hypothetical protein